MILFPLKKDNAPGDLFDPAANLLLAHLGDAEAQHIFLAIFRQKHAHRVIDVDICPEQQIGHPPGLHMFRERDGQ